MLIAVFVKETALVHVTNWPLCAWKRERAFDLHNTPLFHNLDEAWAWVNLNVPAGFIPPCRLTGSGVFHHGDTYEWQ